LAHSVTLAQIVLIWDMLQDSVNMYRPSEHTVYTVSQKNCATIHVRSFIILKIGQRLSHLRHLSQLRMNVWWHWFFFDSLCTYNEILSVNYSTYMYFAIPFIPKMKCKSENVPSSSIFMLLYTIADNGQLVMGYGKTRSLIRTCHTRHWSLRSSALLRTRSLAGRAASTDSPSRDCLLFH